MIRAVNVTFLFGFAGNESVYCLDKQRFSDFYFYLNLQMRERSLTTDGIRGHFDGVAFLICEPSSIRIGIMEGKDVSYH